MARPVRPAGQSNAAASSVALVGAVVATLTSFLIAYLVSQAERGFAGAFFVATAVLTIAGNSLSLGTSTSLVYFMPDTIGDSGPAPRGLIVQTLRTVAIISITAAVAIHLVAPAFAELISEERATEISQLIRWASPAIPAWAMTTALLAASRGLGSMNPTVAVNQIFRPGGQLLLIGVLFIGDDPSARAVGIAWMIPVVVGFVFSVVAVVRLGGAIGTSSPVSSSVFWSYARPRAASSALQISLERIDVLFVVALVGAEAGDVYGALTRYVAAGNFLIYAVVLSSSYSLRKELAAERHEAAGKVLKQTTSWIMLVAWPYFLVLAFKPEPLADLLNPGYVSDARFLAILAVGMMFSAAAGPIDLTLLMLGRSKIGLIGVAGAVAIDIVLLLVLAPRFGLAGAAIAWAAGVIFQNGFAAAMVQRSSGLTSFGEAWMRAALLTLVAVIPVSLVTGRDFSDLLVVGAVAVPILLAGIWLQRRPFGLEQTLPSP